MNAMVQALLMVSGGAAVSNPFTMTFETDQTPAATDLRFTTSYTPFGLVCSGTVPFEAGSATNGVPPGGGVSAGKFTNGMIDITTLTGFNWNKITYDWNSRPGATQLILTPRGGGSSVTKNYSGTGGGGVWLVGETAQVVGFIDHVRLTAILQFGAIDNIKFEYVP